MTGGIPEGIRLAAVSKEVELLLDHNLTSRGARFGRDDSMMWCCACSGKACAM